MSFKVMPANTSAINPVTPQIAQFAKVTILEISTAMSAVQHLQTLWHNCSP
jgi:hypothetical protein